MVRDLYVNVYNSSTLWVNWTKPNITNGMILYYNVTWFATGSDNRMSDSTPSNETYFIIGDLLACTDYTVEVRARTEASDSIAWSNATDASNTTSVIESRLLTAARLRLPTHCLANVLAPAHTHALHTKHTARLS